MGKNAIININMIKFLIQPLWMILRVEFPEATSDMLKIARELDLEVKLKM